MTRFYVDTDADEPCPIGLSEPTDQLTYFLSFAVAERYGAQHELSKAANLVKIKHRVDMNPILNFVDRNVEGPQEHLALEQTSWQDPERLANCVREVIEAIGRDNKVQGYLAVYPEVVPRLEELFEVCLWAMENGARVRLSFELGPEPLKKPLVIPGDGTPEE